VNAFTATDVLGGILTILVMFVLTRQLVLSRAQAGMIEKLDRVVADVAELRQNADAEMQRNADLRIYLREVMHEEFKIISERLDRMEGRHRS
jgi:hypothetical protein